MDLADPAGRLQVKGEFGPAHRDPNAVAVSGERAHHVAAEEAGAAEDGDQRFGGDIGHAHQAGRCAAEYRIDSALYRGRLRREPEVRTTRIRLRTPESGC